MRCYSAIVCLAAAVCLDAELAVAQIESRSMEAAAAITAADVRHYIGVIAHDSMKGRDTPSAGLEKTAQYVADQFKALGLKPAGNPLSDPQAAVRGLELNTPASWLQYYTLPGSLRGSPGAALRFTAALAWAGTKIVNEQGWSVEAATTISFQTSAYFAVDTISEPREPWPGLFVPSVQSDMPLITGHQTPESISRAHLGDGVVLYVPPVGLDSAVERRVIREIAATSDVVIFADEDSAAFAARRTKAFEHPPVAIDKAFDRSIQSHWAAYVWPGAVRDFLQRARIDLVLLRADTMPRTRNVPAIGVLITPATVLAAHDTATAVNAAAVLPGTDSLLREQFIVIAAHMDNIGITHGRSDSIHNGANDNASGVAGILALAKAFSQPAARPKRPIIFLATSGGARDKAEWGARVYADPAGTQAPISLSIALDMVGRMPGDSLLMNGLSELEFEARPDWLAAQHPELGLKLVDGGSVFTAESDHIAFVERNVPSLYVHAGNHDDSPQALDALDSVNPEQEERALRMIYYLVQDLANSAHLPRWTQASRDRRGRFLGR